MAIMSTTNNGWLSTINQNPYNNRSRRKKTSPVVVRSPLKESSFNRLSSSKNTVLHQTRVSTFFKKNFKRKRKRKHFTDDVCIIDSPDSNKGNGESTMASIIEKELTCGKETLDTEIPYDEEALFGPCGDSINETTAEIEDICDDSDIESVIFAVANLNDIELSPCVISKHRKTPRVVTRHTKTLRNHIVCEMKSKNEKNVSYFKPVVCDTFPKESKKTCVRKLSLKKHKDENLYETKLLKFDDDALGNSQYQPDSDSLSCIGPPSPIIFSDNINVDEDNRGLSTDSEDSGAFRHYPYNNVNMKINLESRNIIKKHQEKNSINSIFQDIGGSYSCESCYEPPSPIKFTESL